jgi:3,4-dihydroxy 2-butanone 4-phosphate synthase/GTP cyclohydrolase II
LGEWASSERKAAAMSASQRVAAAVEDVRNGRPVVIVDPPIPGAESSYPGYDEGYVAVAAEHCGADTIAFMATHACGLICLCLTGERCDELQLTPMARRNEHPSGAAYQISIEARHGTSTGISAADRALTVAVAIDPERGPADLVSPGHLLPLRGRPGGVLERAGQAEAIIDLARLAGRTAAGVICGVMNDSGAMATPTELEAYCRGHGFRLVSVADIVAHRLAEERGVARTGALEVEVAGARRNAVTFLERPSGAQHLALVGDLGAGEPARVTVHRCHPLGGHPLAAALEELARDPQAVLVCLDAAVPDLGLALAEGSTREDGAGIVAEILADLGVTSVRRD